MPSLHRLELAYRSDVSAWFQALQHLSAPVWLDSGRPGQSLGRYDVLAADPIEQVEVPASDWQQGLATLRQVIQQNRPCPPELPFCGGAIGFLSYEFGRAMMGLPAATQRLLSADLQFAVYEWALVADHERCTAQLVGSDPDQLRAVRDLLSDVVDATDQQQRKPEWMDQPASGEATAAYQDAFARIQHYIREGDIYQVNFTRRWQAEAPPRMSADQLYLNLREISPAPFGAYLGFDGCQVLSNSPEQFLRYNPADRQVLTKPIKGTRPRSVDQRQDERLAQLLRNSPKDKAENLMIVDLLRNDLGRVCTPGTISTPSLFALESYATVHQLVSTVKGELAVDKDAVDLLQACFPGGSITGAPKLRAMQIIDELETQSRELYCGSVFRLGFDGALDSNITIRTVLRQRQQLYYWAGGGIVADSGCQSEYQESHDKAAAFRRLLNSSRG